MAETYTGVACKKCGSTERYVREKRCVKCRRERDRERQQTEKRRARDRVRSKLPHRKAAQKKLRDTGYHNNWNKNDWLKDPRKRLLKKARERAKMYGRTCTITIDDISIPKKCPLLGIPIFLGSRKIKNNSPTIDRKNSRKGYVPGNVWVVSWRANRLKSDATQKELIRIIENWP